MSKTALWLFVSLVFAAALPALAQNAPEDTSQYPSKMVEIYVGAGPGTGSDSVARFFADKLRGKTGQQFMVINRAGLYGQLAANEVMRARPDGYTLFITPNSTLTVNPHLVRNATFDPNKDLTPITTIAKWGLVLLVNAERTPAKTLDELTAFLKSGPAKHSFASGHYAGRAAGEIYRRAAGVDVVHVPYKAIPPAVTDLLGGHVDFLFSDIVAGLPHVKAGRLRALAVTSSRRVEALPEVPTLAEAGIGGTGVPLSWFAVLMPANAPADLKLRIASLFNAVLEMPETRDFYQRISADPFPGTPENLVELIKRETRLQGDLIKSLGIEKFD
jgi:tripartite-type tricarboxylate transporter receptor subunit TctC